MSDEKIPSTLSLAILGLIASRPLSGYDLRKLFRITPMGHFSTSPGAIYPALRRLKQRGLIRGKVKNKGTLRPKQLFEITGDGMKSLRTILSEPITADDIKWNLDRLLLRFAFMGDVLGKESSLRFLRELARETNKHIVSLQKHLEDSGKKMNITAKYALEYGIARYRATSQWAKNIMRDISAR